MRGILPERIIHRRKRGFSAPVASWMTGPLRELVYDSVSRRRGGPLPFFEPGAVDRLIAEHDAGAAEHALQVWALLTVHLWHDWMWRWRAPEAPPAYHAAGPAAHRCAEDDVAASPRPAGIQTSNVEP
jgi:asparagine synthase (glutamine-hydrolysing)